MKKRKFFSNSGILKWKMPLLISILFWMSLSGTAEAEVQLRSISLRLENVSLSEALSRIEEASGYSFFYDENKIDLSRQVSVNAQNKAVKDILKNILFSTGMTFEISNNQIVLVPEKKAAAKEVSVAVVQQQTHIVKGIVVDNLGEPVPGANVVEKGTTNGIITDMDGAFSLTVAPDAVLEISYIGYVTQSVSVKGKSTLNITLREDSQALEEVVVTGFGLSQKKATLTGAVTAVGSEDISRSVASTASGALVGKIAGLNTRQTDGRPGATTSIQIRNMGDPLYVIDGVQSDAGQFNNIDFNDIESISVLKDASAAIYGVRAANGVVVVNTKKGKRNTKNTVSLSFDKEYSDYGCPYVQEDCDVQEPSDNLVIYGHHMSNGLMFAHLEKFKSKDFWSEHRMITFNTLTDKQEYEIVAVFRTVVYTADDDPLLCRDDPRSFRR